MVSVMYRAEGGENLPGGELSKGGNQDDTSHSGLAAHQPHDSAQSIRTDLELQVVFPADRVAPRVLTRLEAFPSSASRKRNAETSSLFFYLIKVVGCLLHLLINDAAYFWPAAVFR